GGGEREYPLDAETTVIGRSVECDIRLNDTGVSRRHGEIRRLPDGQFLYVDAGSTNGSLVNGRAATQVKLMNGDRIELGTAVVEFRREEQRGGAGPRGPRTPPPVGRPSMPPGRAAQPPAERTPPPFDPHQPTSPSAARRPPTPPPGGREPAYPERPGRGGEEYREGPSPRFRDDPGPRSPSWGG
ncbi:FHA domain-containing protein, partial [Frankia sp. EI5c]|uniref:FHA domain-containing protein n=1 Tax=Frankia sp. EI5c TaxID=683316 RepID=UPI001F5B4B51